MKVASLVLCAVATIASGEAKQKATTPLPSPERVVQLTKELAQLKDKTSRQLQASETLLKKPASSNRSTAIKADITRLKTVFAILKAGQPPSLSPFTFTEFKPGTTGVIPATTSLYVSQVVDEDEFIANLESFVTRFDTRTGRLLGSKRQRSTRQYWFKGLSTEGVSDGQSLELKRKDAFVITGTRRYSTVSGGTNTVPLFEVLDKTALKLVAEKAAADNAVAKKKKVAADLVTRKKQTAQRRVLAAQSKLRFAKRFLKKGKKSSARKYLELILKDFPNTDAAKEAKALLEKL